jgi:SPP1 family predicted phage head-tail adaptor
MRAGSLDRRVTILRRALTRNAYGEQEETYSTLDTVWAQKLDVAGREFLAARGTMAENSTRFRLRYRSDLVLTDRLSYNSVEYDIQQIAELGRQDGLEIIAVARVP